MANGGLSTGEVQFLEGELLRARRELLARVQRRRGGERELEGTGDPARDALDEAKQEQDVSLLHSLDESERDQLGEIDHALAKIGNGTYGICEGTGEPIGVERLKAQPWTRYSLAYQEQIERAHRGGVDLTPSL